MIICQTPLRVSFFGGGTDFPEFFSEHRGAVLATAIDKSIFHAITRLHSNLFNFRIRLAYRKVECVSNLDELRHKPAREILRHFGIGRDIEVSLTADLPAYSGLGSSSSFTVGMINALSAHQGRFMPQADLARLAIHVERGILRETVGLQDQIIAAYGGLNVIEFSRDDHFVVHRVAVSKAKLQELQESLLLFFTGRTRKASAVEARKVEGMRRKEGVRETLRRMLGLVERGHHILTGNEPLSAFGRLLDATWRQKRSLDPGVSTPAVDRMYRRATEAGALGGKLLGAGGGGFLLLFVPPERRARVVKSLGGYGHIPITINAPGSRIIHS